MSKAIDLKRDPVPSVFFRYLLPAIAGLMVKSVFIIVDSVFIGRGVGHLGLAALSLTLPFFTLFTAIAMMVGIGGAAKMSVEFGKGEPLRGQRIFFQSMLFISLVNGLLVSLSLLWLPQIIGLMGAQGELADLSVEYMQVILLFFFVYGPAWVLSAFVRNDGNPALAMQAMVTGAVLNIVLDYVFIFEFGWGMGGGALATGISQLVIFLVLLSHFVKGDGQLALQWQTPSLSEIPAVLRSGLAVFFTESAVAVTVVVFNLVLLAQYSEQHVTAYSIVANLGVVGLFMMVGIGQACQPIISFNYGAGQMHRVRQTLALGLKVALATGLAISAFILLAARPVAALFIADNPELIQLTSVAMKLYFIAMPFIALNMLVATLFQAIEHNVRASLISLSRGIVFVILGLFTLPLFFPELGVWTSVLFAEGVTALISLVLLVRFFHSSSFRSIQSPAQASQPALSSPNDQHLITEG